MPDYPGYDLGGNAFDSQGQVTTTSAGTVITGAAGANAKGAYTQITAATTYDYAGFYVEISQPSGTSVQLIADIAIGAAASEQIVVADLPAYIKVVAFGLVRHYCPVHIPNGSRITARIATRTGGSETATIALIGVAHTFGMSSGLGKGYNISTADPRGTAIAIGATANTKTAWVQLIASTADPIRAIAPHYHGIVTGTDSRDMFDVGIGAAASEVVVLANIQAATPGFVDNYPAAYGPFPVDIPASTRISMRAQSTRAAGVTAYGTCMVYL